MKTILITNDDSISAPGLMRLVDCCPEDAEIYVVAPAEPHSGQSSAITVGKPLRIAEAGEYRGAKLFTVTGTPVDCVKLALSAIVPRRPDLVFAGINHGSNSGCNVIYSGTMGAVMEGCLEGITSCGFSLTHHSMKADFGPGMPFVKQIIANLMSEDLPKGVCLNVNIPAGVDPKGVRVCRATEGYWTDEYKEYIDPFGKPFYWLTGRFVTTDTDATDTDEYWMGQGYVSAVPVAVEMTDMAAIPTLSKRFDS